jgi:hypothetical protein
MSLFRECDGNCADCPYGQEAGEADRITVLAVDSFGGLWLMQLSRTSRPSSPRPSRPTAPSQSRAADRRRELSVV